MAIKSTRYGYNGGYQAQYNDSLADVTSKRNEKNVRSGKNVVKVALVAIAISVIAITSSGCNPGDGGPCDVTGPNTALTTCAYAALTGK